MNGDWFVAAVIGLQTCATIAYLTQRDWKQAIVWGCVAISNLAYLSLSRT